MIFDYSNKTWTELNLTNGPGRRINHEMATIWGTDKVVLYGGQDCYNAFRETWIFDLSENNWTKQEPKKIPTALFGFDFSHVWNSNKVVLFGGFTDLTKVLDETWMYDYINNTWINKTLPGSPKPRQSTAMASIYGTDDVVLFGGGAPTYPISDTWVLTLNEGKYYSNGTYISVPYNTRARSAFKTISWNGSTPTNTSLKFQFRTASTLADLLTGCFLGPDAGTTSYYESSPSNISSGHYGRRWMQYKVIFIPNGTKETPVLNNVTIVYNCLPDAVLTSPENNTIQAINKPLFDWNFTDLDSILQQSYQVIIDNNDDFSSIDYDCGEQNSSDQHWQFPSGTGYTVLPDGIWYWKVRTKDNDGDWGYYSPPWSVVIDTKPPSSAVSIPDDNGVYNTLTDISGTASDTPSSSGLSEVCIVIKRMIDDSYWNGIDWVSGEVWLSTEGTSSWTFDSQAVTWTTGTEYNIRSRALDNASNIEIPGPGIRFIFDGSDPTSIITHPVDETYLNELYTISGSAFDTGGAGLSKVELNILRTNDTRYWDGNKWSKSPEILQATGTEEWSFDSSAVIWSSDTKYTVRSRATDHAGNIEMPAPGNVFYMDLDKPTSTIDIPINNSYINKLDSISGRALDTGGSCLSNVNLSILRKSDMKCWNGVDWSPENTWLPVEGGTDWSYDATEVPWTSNTEYMISSRASDHAKNIEIPDGGIVFLFDSETPESDIGYPLHNSCLNELVTIYGTAYDTGGSGLKTLEISIKRISDDNYWRGSSWRTGEFWIPIQVQGSWEYSRSDFHWSSDTGYNIRIRASDNAGNVEPPDNGTDFLYDYFPPTVTIEINNNSVYTNTTEVMLNIHAEDTGSGVSHMALSTDSTNWAPWEPYVEQKPFTLSGNDGNKFVYIKVKDLAENIGQPDSDHIILDTTPPEHVSVSINNNDEYTNSVDITVMLNAVDTLSGVADMSFSLDITTTTPWEPFKSEKDLTLIIGDGEKSVLFRVSDRAGNTAVSSDVITLDTEPPHSLSIEINDNAAETNSTSVTLKLSAKDDTSGVHLMTFSNDGSNWALWENFTRVHDYIISGEDGEKIIYFKVIDCAGNEADFIFDKINLNTSMPAVEDIDDDPHSDIGQNDQEKIEIQINWDLLFLIIIVIIIIVLIIIIFVIRKRRTVEAE